MLARSYNSLRSYLPLSAEKPHKYYSFWCHLPFGAEKPNIRPCPEHILFSFDGIFMKVADNLERHKISDEFRLRQNRTIHFGVTCPWVPKNLIFHFVWIIVYVISMQSLWNLQINRTGTKNLTSWKLGNIVLLILELHALDCQHVWYQVSDRCPLGYLLRYSFCYWQVCHGYQSFREKMRSMSLIICVIYVKVK